MNSRYIFQSFLIICFLLCSKFTIAQNIGFFFENDKVKRVIPVEIYNNLIVLPITLNNQYTLKFILDTGVRSTILINKSFADSAGIEYQRKIQLYGAGDSEPVNALVTNEVSLSMPGIGSNEISALVLEEDFLQLEHHLGIKIDGLIGYDIFGRFAVKVDYIHEKITLYEPGNLALNSRYFPIDLEIIESKPIARLNIQLDNSQAIRAKVLMDIGASHALVLDRKSDENIKLPENHIEASLGRGLAGEINGYLGRIEGIDFGEKKLSGVITSYPEDKYAQHENNFKRNGSIGGELLKKFTVIFDFLNSKMYLRPNKTFKYPFEYNMSGLEFTAQGKNLNRYVISKIRKNSAASDSEFMAGDILISLNNTPSSKLNLTKIYTRLNLKEGKRINLTVYRDGKYISQTIYLKREI